MSSPFGEETIRLVPGVPGWVDNYAAALRPTSMGEVSQEVVLADSCYIGDRALLPVESPQWGSSRIRTGVVMGAVQSGKTASMIGVLARALDNDVNVAVVLAGTQTSLWLQTLGRIRDQLDSGPEPLRRRVFLPNPGDLAGPHGRRPSRAYVMTERAAVGALKRDRPIIAVAMKQVDHLLHLGQTLHNVVFPAALAAGKNIRIVVIDDEADDSSITDDDLPWGSPDLETFKQVPRRILDLWEHRSQPGRTVAGHVYATYIAYTATPQANFLQDPQNPLAPRDFVAALRTPGEIGSLEPRSLTYRVPEGLKGWYTGADIFYGDLARTFCVTPDAGEDEQLEQESSSNRASETVATADLAPVRAYLVAVSVRLSRAPGRLGPSSAATTTFVSEMTAREQIAPVSSMLIHPSSAKEDHFKVAEALRTWWNGDGSVVGAGVLTDIETNEELWTSWLDSYHTASQAVSDRFESMDVDAPERQVPSWVELRELLLREVVPGTKIAVINSDPSADYRPEFSPWEDEGRWRAPPNHSTIFIAGNVMSRGLTLEGLLTTHFTRSSAAPFADTQMQMQRWFGYRGSYIDLCRIFLSHEQLSLFTQFADTDHALRSQVLAAMEDSPDSLPDFTVLQGMSFQATGKVAGLTSRPLRPGSRPVVRQLNPAGHDDHNLASVSCFFTGARTRGTLVSDHRGLVTSDVLTLLEAADLLDSLRYTHHGRLPSEVARWSALERQAEITTADPEFPLYRAPVAPQHSLDLKARSPYSMAAYLRFWSACLDRRVRGLMTDDIPPQRWNLLNLDAKRADQPRFRVGLRFGHGTAVDAGPVAELASTLGIQIQMMSRAALDNTLRACRLSTR